MGGWLGLVFLVASGAGRRLWGLIGPKGVARSCPPGSGAQAWQGRTVLGGRCSVDSGGRLCRAFASKSQELKQKRHLAPVAVASLPRSNTCRPISFEHAVSSARKGVCWVPVVSNRGASKVVCKPQSLCATATGDLVFPDLILAAWQFEEALLASKQMTYSNLPHFFGIGPGAQKRSLLATILVDNEELFVHASRWLATPVYPIILRMPLKHLQACQRLLGSSQRLSCAWAS